MPSAVRMPNVGNLNLKRMACSHFSVSDDAITAQTSTTTTSGLEIEDLQPAPLKTAPKTAPVKTTRARGEFI